MIQDIAILNEENYNYGRTLNYKIPKVNFESI